MPVHLLKAKHQIPYPMILNYYSQPNAQLSFFNHLLGDNMVIKCFVCNLTEENGYWALFK